MRRRGLLLAGARRRGGGGGGPVTPAAFRANAQGNDGLTVAGLTVGVAIPGTAAISDYAVVILGNNSDSTAITGVPTGWSLLSGPHATGIGSNWVYGKALASGEPGSTVTWTFAASTRPIAEMILFSNATAMGMQIAVSATDTAAVGSVTVPTLPAVPAGAAVALLLGRIRSGTGSDVTVVAPYSQGVNERSSSNFGAGANPSVEVAYQIAASAGSYGGESLAVPLTSRGTVYLIAIPPAGAPLGGTAFDGGTPGNAVFDRTVDGGVPSTASFANTYDGGTP